MYVFNLSVYTVRLLKGSILLGALDTKYSHYDKVCRCVHFVFVIAELLLSSVKISLLLMG